MPKTDVYTVSKTHQIPITDYAVQSNTYRCYRITLYKAIHIRLLWPIMLYRQIPTDVLQLRFTKQYTSDSSGQLRCTHKYLHMVQ